MELLFDPKWGVVDKWSEWTKRNGRSGIGFARWPKWRLFGFESDPAGSFQIDLGRVDQPSELFLNYSTKPDGSVRVELPDIAGHGLAESIPLTGAGTETKVAWRNRSVIAPADRVKVRLHLEVAAAYAYELRPVK